jgi:Sec-independent protein translocase protein TatA
MSLGEFFVIVIIILFIIKPSDIPMIISQIKEILNFFDKIKYKILNSFKDNIITEIKNIDEAKNEFNQIINDINILNKNKNKN